MANEMYARSLSFSSNMTNVSFRHDERTPKDEGKIKNYGNHIQWEKTARNEVLIKNRVRQIYHEKFDDAVAEYDSKQKRNDRKIKSMYSYAIKHKGKGGLTPYKEFIVQVGRNTDHLDPDPEKDEQLQKQVLKDYLKSFQEKYPQLPVASASIHVDEDNKGPHLHMVVVPVAKGYKRGVSVRPSFSKAVDTGTPDKYKAFCEDNRALMLKVLQRDWTPKATRGRVGTHDYIPPQALRDLYAKGQKELNEASDLLDQAQATSEKMVTDAQLHMKQIKAESKLHIERTNDQVKKLKIVYAQQWQNLKMLNSQTSDAWGEYRQKMKKMREENWRVWRSPTACQEWNRATEGLRDAYKTQYELSRKPGFLSVVLQFIEARRAKKYKDQLAAMREERNRVTTQTALLVAQAKKQALEASKARADAQKQKDEALKMLKKAQSLSKDLSGILTQAKHEVATLNGIRGALKTADAETYKKLHEKAKEHTDITTKLATGLADLSRQTDDLKLDFSGLDNTDDLNR